MRGCGGLRACKRSAGQLEPETGICRGIVAIVYRGAFGGHSGGISASGNPSRKGVEKLEGLDELVLGDVARPECGEGGKGW